MPGIVQLEKDLESCLVGLKEKYGLCAVKAEFEAEGSSFRDLVRLRRLTASHKVPLYLKIGGVEALRDIKDALSLGVDGLVAPMVESPFGVVKFTKAVDSVFSDRGVFKSINIETLNAVECIDAILEEAKGKVNNITIGRTDLSQSFLDSKTQPDSDMVFDLIGKLSNKVHAAGLTLTVGGSITKGSVQKFKQCQENWEGCLASIETRKIVLPADQMLGQENALPEALKFEELYLSSKLEMESWLSQADRARLIKLKKRI